MDALQKLPSWTAILIISSSIWFVKNCYFFSTIVGTRMWSYSALVLTVTALTCVSAQDFFEGNIVKKPKNKLVAINIQDGKGKRIHE